ncbi:hypothetical protein CFP65_3129 [Kitasatospora sp. MMS16-BH015]|uniref:PD40 domain-containing protein n=1 Tax=Kitasatospora sp. MMS16-BH015 TaxID=2018025 RepID=UPI000CA2008F|nr:PD40 domain-containing protein [Kitasatospora sp. MMS16-BH015]AUG77936.1 hypothetical protein CFP65_3129 [Kitasatospora sp. MMS16-BH015]
MSARARRRSSAVALTVAITTGATLLLTACDPSAGSTGSTKTDAAAQAPIAAAPVAAGAAAQSAAPSTAPSAPAAAVQPAADTTPSRAASAAPQAAEPAAPLNGTAHNGLTISNGTRYVVMNGTTVDFGTAVRDLAWSPDGRKAAFVDGNGDLAVAAPDGTGRITVAKHGAGETWSHPAWQVAPALADGTIRAKNNLQFVVTTGGTTRLETVVATGGTPQPLRLGSYSEENFSPNPETGNTWVSGGTSYGATAYANSENGEVYYRDDNLRQQGGSVTKGSEPTISPDSRDIVFVRASHGHDHLFAYRSGRQGQPTVVDLTPNATTDYTEPTYSPDGRTIAARTADGIVTLPADGSAAPKLVSGYHGLPSYRPQA